MAKKPTPYWWVVMGSMDRCQGVDPWFVAVFDTDVKAQRYAEKCAEESRRIRNKIIRIKKTNKYDKNIMPDDVTVYYYIQAVQYGGKR